MPAELESWVTRISETVVPVFPSSVQALRGLSGRPGLSIDQVARLATTDLGIGAAVLGNVARARAANAVAAPEDGAEARPGTVAHGIMLLGLEHVVPALAGLPVYDDSPAHAGAMRVAVRAAFAYACAAHWSRQRADSPPEAIALAAQMRHLGELGAWLVAPEAATRAQHHALARDQGEATVLGIEYAGLAGALTERCGLPPLVAESVQAGSQLEHDGEPRRVEPLERRALTADLAYRVARAGAVGWDHASVQSAFAPLAAHLGQSEDAVRADAHRLAALAARDPISSRLYSPGLALLLDARAVQPALPARARPGPPAKPAAASERAAASATRPGAAPNAVPNAAPPAAEARPRPEPRRRSDSRTVPKSEPKPDPRPQRGAGSREGSGTEAGRGRTPHRTRALNMELAKQEKTAAEALAAMPGALAADLGLDRVVIALLSQDRQALAARFSSRREPDWLARFRFDLTERGLLTQLLEKGVGLWVHPGNREKYARLIPAGLAELEQGDGFYVVALNVNQRAIGIIYADEPGRGSLSKDGFRAFRALVGQCGEAIERASARARQAA